MASVAGMAWEAAERAFRAGYEAYQATGPESKCPWQGNYNKSIGLWTAGKDAARRRISLRQAWVAFVERERAVM
jgi:hypothetical protein